MEDEHEIAQAIASFVSTSDVELRQYYPHRLEMTTAEVYDTDGQVRMVMGRHHLLEFGPFNYFFLRFYLSEMMGEAFREAVTLKGDYIPIGETPYAALESWYQLFVSTQPSYRQFAPIWKAVGRAETPFCMEPACLGYWKSRVSADYGLSLENRLRGRGFSAEFDPEAGMMYYSNLQSVALGLPPNHSFLRVQACELNSFGKQIATTFKLEKALKYASRREVESWPTTDERKFAAWRLKKMQQRRKKDPERAAYLLAREKQEKIDELILLARHHEQN